MDKLQPPGPLNLQGNLAENWRKWKQRFQLFSSASGLSEKDEKVKSATLLHVAGEEALEVYNTFTWDSDGDENKVNMIMAKFEAYCNPRKNITWERHVFNTRNQQIGETIDQYVTDLKTKAKSCEFGTLTDSLIRDRIVCGIIDDHTRSRLLREPDLTLQKALDICRANEITTVQMKSFTAGNTASPTTDKVEVNVVDKDRQRLQSDRRKFQCGKCGSQHTRQQSCPAIGAECYKCGRRNHFARVCRSTPKRADKPRLHTIEQNSSDEDDGMYIAMINDHADTEEWEVNIRMNEQRVTFKIDTGAQCNVISKETYDKVSRQPLTKSRAKLTAFGGHKIRACGKTVIACEYKEKYTPVEFEVVEQHVPSVLGLKTCTEMGLVRRIDSISNKTEDMLNEYRDVFTGLGCISDVTHHIQIDRP